MNDKDRQILKDSALEAAEVVVAALSPALAMSWGLSKALYGAGLKLREKRALEWVEMVRDNPLVFTESVVGTATFQDGFVLALERYIRERDAEKRKVMKFVFLGYASSENMERFPLERLYEALAIISSAGVRYLRFIDQVIIPQMQAVTQAEAARIGAADGYRWDVARTQAHHQVSNHILQWIHDRWNPNVVAVKESQGYSEATDAAEWSKRMFAREEEETKLLREAMAEFVSLGLCSTGVEGGGSYGGGSGHIAHTFTDFGWELLGYLKSSAP